ncbi:D-inositol-3-phosphate glycosyltransferase [Pseudomonas fluorescens]|uniref:glycosyltransferase family 4 protein n=1 Tax=Pseudomonas fluorescens TaxID=294 RepID=UPI0012423243|nr:glycosyltransferase family 4 protein [Pseudomonas fluorescens]VVQ02138.1 D-inositol-3-phosphate glycosyltransferase [Pseudomonas fluorescens]
MNIVLVGPSLAQRGGVVSVINSLRKYLIAHGSTVRTIATTTEGGRKQNVLTFLRAWVAILDTCLVHRADVIHLHMASRGSCLRKSLLGLTCWAFRMPFIIHLHGGRFSVFHEEELGYFGRAFVDFVFRRASRVIALSTAWKTWLETTIHLKQVVVVLNGVPSFKSTREQTIPTVLFLGRLSSNKGTGELIAAMREVTQRIPNSILELGGDGDIETYRQQASDLPNIRFLGWVDDAGRQAALARATVYCLPSWNEGLPMSVLEAMSAGLPVISTPVGGIPEAVTEGVTGLLVKPGDTKGLATAICKILLNPAIASAMGSKGQNRHRERFSADSMGRNCLEVYASCVKH